MEINRTDPSPLVRIPYIKLNFILQVLFSFATKQVTLKRRSTVLGLPFQFVFVDGLLDKSKKVLLKGKVQYS